MADLVFGEKDNGALVQVPRGSKVTIELPENPMTGHQWAIDSIDEVFLVPEGDAFLIGQQMGLGPGGVRRFYFRVKGPGCTSLSFINKRRLETGTAAANTFKLAVRIVK